MTSTCALAFILQAITKSRAQWRSHTYSHSNIGNISWSGMEFMFVVYVTENRHYTLTHSQKDSYPVDVLLKRNTNE